MRSAQQVFSKAEIWFSTDGETYEDEFLPYSYIPDDVLENARNVSISLHGRRGKLIKLHLYFAARWIIIGEVTFDASELPASHFLSVETISSFCIWSFTLFSLSFYEKTICRVLLDFPRVSSDILHIAWPKYWSRRQEKVAQINERILNCYSQIVMLQEIL